MENIGINSNNNSSNNSNNNSANETRTYQTFCPTTDSNGRVIFVPKEEHIFLKNFKSNYVYMLVAAIIYAIIFTFSLYRNFTGIVTPLFPIASVALIVFCTIKNGATLKKDWVFYAAAIIIIGINLSTTKDFTVTFLDYVAIILLTISMSLHIFYDDSKWGLGKYLSEIMVQAISSLEYIASTIEDGIAYKKEHTNSKKNPLVGYVIVGILITIPLLIVVLLLLGSADYFFGQFLESIIIDPLSNIDFSNIDLLIMLIASFVGSYAFIKKLCSHTANENVIFDDKKPVAIAITVNSILGFVYLIFSAFQIVNLFLGQAKLPENYTYAEYARQGFFQLVVVCLINMVLVLISLYYFENNIALKIILTIISACTYLMIASSTFKMYMYVSAYQLTYTRVFVFWALLVIFMAMNGITVYIYNRTFNLFKYCMIMVTVLYIIFAYVKPEALIARNNLSEKFYKSRNCQDIDYGYLHRLSSDASPAIVEAYLRENDEILYDRVIDSLVDSDKSYNKKTTIRNFNLSSYQEHVAVGNIR